MRPLGAALLLLDGLPAEALTSSLQLNPAPALALLRAVLPAATATSLELMGEAEELGAAAERLALCIATVQVLLPAATAALSAASAARSATAAPAAPAAPAADPASASALREGLTTLLPFFHSAGHSAFLPAETREKARRAATRTDDGGHVCCRRRPPCTALSLLARCT
jgi:hypothetical protein